MIDHCAVVRIWQKPEKFRLWKIIPKIVSIIRLKKFVICSWNHHFGHSISFSVSVRINQSFHFWHIFIVKATIYIFVPKIFRIDFPRDFVSPVVTHDKSPVSSIFIHMVEDLREIDTVQNNRHHKFHSILTSRIISESLNGLVFNLCFLNFCFQCVLSGSTPATIHVVQPR